MITYDINALKAATETLKGSVTTELDAFVAEIEQFTYKYDCDLDGVTLDILYGDMRTLRGWRNRLAQMIRKAVRLQNQVIGFMMRLTELHKMVVDEDLVNNATDRVGHGWAVQERVAAAGMVALDLRKIVVDATQLAEYTKMQVQALNDKRHDLRDACQEVQLVQGLVELSVGTAE